MNVAFQETAITPQQTIGQIAVELPGATAVFRRLKLDFCCGGNVVLSQAVADKGLDLQAVVQELSALRRPSGLPDASAPADLVDHIVNRYHDVHRAQLPELIRMARRVEAVHRANPQAPAGLANALEAMEQELLPHMHKEEAVLFPMLRAGGNDFVAHPIGMMRSEHVEHGKAMEHIFRLTNDITTPPEACNTWRALYAGLAQFSEDLINHIHLENNVLFPQFEASASATQGCGSGGCGCSGG
jgi:regulator of cell morphogenesis and NO signaling